MADKKEFLNGAKAIGSLKNATQLYTDGMEKEAIEAFESCRKLLEGLDMMADNKEFPNGTKSNAGLRNAIQLHLDGKAEEATEAFEKCKITLAEQLENVKRESQKPEHQQRRQEYADSPEDLNGFLKEEIAQDQNVDTIYIEKDSTGHSYESLFGKYLNVHVTSVEVKDPYISDDHQVENFRIICDLIVGKKIPVQTIKLVTRKIKQESKWELKEYLQKQNINLQIEIDPDLHDRRIRLSTGWVFHLGRGLDFYEKSGRSLGDFDQWPCKVTTVILKNEKEGKT